MTIAVSDPGLLDALQSATDAVDLTTPAGKVIGTFKPAAWGVPPSGFVPPLSDEEIEERIRTFDGRPLGDFFKELESRQ